MFGRRLRIRQAPPQLPTSLSVACGGVDVAINLRVSARARRLLLKFDAADERFELVLPDGVRWADAQAFAHAQRPWIGARLATVPPRVAFEHGAVIPILGTAHLIEHRPGGGPPVRREGQTLIVTGGAEHLARRVTDYLRAQARLELTQRTRAYAERVGKPVGRITLTDPRGRWGSCSARGTICYSWRLIFAPPAVMDYVVAHEVSHLVELNHSPRFWNEVTRLVGPFDDSRDWLRRNATRLMRFG